MACKGGTLSDGKDKFYPNAFYEIGDLFLTTRNENPSVRFGGVWELFGKGKTLVCVNEDDNDFNEVKKTGGEKTHTLTINEIPYHDHKGYLSGGDKKSITQASHGGYNSAQATQDTTSTGGNKPHNNLQPYITCYIWIRVK